MIKEMAEIIIKVLKLDWTIKAAKINPIKIRKVIKTFFVLVNFN